MGEDERLDHKLAPQDFVADFVWAARAVFDQPSVALVSIALWGSPTVFVLASGHQKSPIAVLIGSLLCLLLGFFGFGWLGAERMFFLHRREGKSITLGELLSLAPSFIGRFASLTFWVGIVVTPIGIVGCVVAAHLGVQPDTPLGRGLIRGGVAIIMIAVDLALTFVTSALAFSTSSAREAIRIGLSMIRRTWPRSGLYILCPPLALNMLNTIYPTQIPLVSLVTTSALALLALITKGATAAFYLRERPVDADAPASAVVSPPV
jgi:hypothetical protein